MSKSGWSLPISTSICWRLATSSNGMLLNVAIWSLVFYCWCIMSNDVTEVTLTLVHAADRLTRLFGENVFLLVLGLFSICKVLR